MDNTPKEDKPRRGFAAWPREKLLAVASQGGKAVHAQGVAHEFDSAEAKIAGAKGGRICHENRRKSLLVKRVAIEGERKDP